MKKVKLVFLILLVQLVAFSCKKKNECETIKDAPPEFLDYFYFKEGSWWVYQLKDSGEVYDTVRVTNQEKVYETPNNHEGIKPCIYYHLAWFSHTNQRFINPKQSKDRDFLLSSTGGSNGIWGIWHSSNSTYGDVGLFFIWPVIEGKILNITKAGRNEIKTFISDTMSTKTILGEFNNSVHTKIKFSFYDREVPNNQISDIWLGQNVGILKFRFNDSSTWELVDYKIK